MLILFDIDGTLLLSGGAGREAMMTAGRQLRGASFTFDGVDFAGRLDPLIWRDAALANGIVDPDAEHDAFRALYAEALRERLAASPTARALAGVVPLLDAIAEWTDVTVGVLTGNYPETGRMKLAAAGLAPERFVVGAWGSDGPTRRDLPAVAIERCAERTGRRPAAEHVVILGDTPHDIDCARAAGCMVIAVATGPSYTHDALAAHAPDVLVRDLSDTAALVDHLAAARSAARNAAELR